MADPRSAAPDVPPPVLDDRKAAVLRAVVAEYVATEEPVGSRRVVALAQLDVSAATVRNEMKALEDAGYIWQPHTSAGRVPTDAGYRFLVDNVLARPDRDHGGDADHLRRRETVAQLIGQPRDVEELVQRTTAVLSQLTQLVALVITPTIDNSRCRRLDLVPLGPSTVLLLLVADNGAVEKHLLELGAPTSPGDVDRARTALNEVATGERLRDLSRLAAKVRDEAPTELRDLLRRVVAQLDLVEREVDRRVSVGGAASLATALEGEGLRGVLGVLEQRGTLARLLTAHGGEGTTVTIGGEHDVADLQPTSLVSQRYRLAGDGSLGVLGPTRMDYAAVLATVRAVADQLEATLEEF